MRMHGGSGGIVQPLLTSVLGGGQCSTSLPDHFRAGKKPVSIRLEAWWAPEPIWTLRRTEKYRDFERQFTGHPSTSLITMLSIHICFCYSTLYEGRTESHEQLFFACELGQQTKESAVVDGTSCCVTLECLVTSIACIT